MVVPGTASHPAVTAENSLTDQKTRDCIDSVIRELQNKMSHEGRKLCMAQVSTLMAMLRSKLRARDIITRKSIENAVTVVFALGGSTNAVLHLLAIAHEAQVDFSIHDFGDVGARVPLIGNLSPHGK